MSGSLLFWSAFVVCPAATWLLYWAGLRQIAAPVSLEEPWNVPEHDQHTGE